MKFTPNENILRVALIVFSIVFGILSVALIALGVVYIDELWWPRHYVGLDFLKLPTLVIILGSLSLLMSIAGCLCAKTYNRTMLLAFGTILVIILCLELTVAVIAFKNFEEHEGAHTKTHRLMIKQYNSDNEEERLYFQNIEEHYKCCGVTGNEEDCITYYDSSEDHSHEDSTEETTTLDPFLRKNGCAGVVNTYIKIIASQIGYTAIVFSILHIIEMQNIFLIRRLSTEGH